MACNQSRSIWALSYGKGKCVYVGRKVKVGNLRERSLTSLAQSRPTIYQYFCLSKVKQPLVKFATDCNLSVVVDDGILVVWVALLCFTSSVTHLYMGYAVTHVRHIQNKSSLFLCACHKPICLKAVFQDLEVFYEHFKNFYSKWIIKMIQGSTIIILCFQK